MYVLDDVDARERAVPGGQAAGELDVAVNDGKEAEAEARPQNEAIADVLPEDSAQSDFAEPQPVDVVEGDQTEH